jgi:predicted nucleic-acid-binding protein
MIGLDTNIIVRYLTQDDPIQSAVATEIMEQRLSEDNPGFVSIVAIVEVVWVLDRVYGMAPPEVAAAVERLLQADVLIMENEQEVFTAMIALKEDRGSFADALVAQLGTRAGCAHTLTFDRKALRLPGFKPAWPRAAVRTSRAAVRTPTQSGGEDAHPERR